MPFAGYKDFDDCVSKNRDKGDPKAYCATIMRKAEAVSVHQDFQPIRRNFMRANCGSADRDCPVGVQAYNTWLESKGLDDKKGLPQKGFGETFAFLAVLEPFLSQQGGKENLIKIDAIHDVCTLNKNCYDWDEIHAGFASLTDRPIDYCEDCEDGHMPSPVGKVMFARPNPRTHSGEVLGWVETPVWNKVKDGTIKYASIVAAGLGDLKSERGSHIRFPTFTRIALIGPRHIPGDPRTTVKVLEGLRPYWDLVNSHSVNPLESASFARKAFAETGSGGMTKKQVKETSTSGDAGIPAGKAGSTAVQNIEELHFTASKVGGPVQERVLSYGQRQELPDSAFADKENRRYPHHHADGSIDMAHLRNANARAAQQNESPTVTGHLERHKKELKVGKFAEASFGLPTDGSWVPQGFVLRGDRVYPENKEAWDAFVESERVAEKVGAIQEAMEEQIASMGKEVADATSQMRNVSGLVVGGTFVTEDKMNKCKEALEARMAESLKDVIRKDTLPVFTKEAVTASRLTALEAASTFFEGLEVLSKNVKLPHFVLSYGGSAQMGEAYRRGFRDAIAEITNLLAGRTGKQ